MKSTFHGLETFRRSIGTQQTVIQTTGPNIANANTPGYSRQRVNMTPTEAFPSPGMNQPNIPGQTGSGVQAGEVTRIREAYLDAQFRGENNKHGYWSSLHDSLTKMEDIMNEPSEDGIANMMDRFWNSLQDLSVHPEDAGARSVVRQNGIALAETLNYTYDSLQAVQKDHKNQIAVHEDKINSLLRQISAINEQVAQVEPHGYLSNDLYDQRDLLVDELSQYMNISVEEVGSGGLAKDMASGRYSIKLLDDRGQEMGVTLVGGAKLEANQLFVTYDNDSGLADKIHLAKPMALPKDRSENFNPKDLDGKPGVTTFNSLDDFQSTGALMATIEAHGYYDNDGDAKGILPDLLDDLDRMAYTFAQEFNEVHSGGWSITEINAHENSDDDDDIPGYEFFDLGITGTGADEHKGVAQNIRVHDDIMDSLDHIAAASEGASAGDGGNARALADVKDEPLNFGGSGSTNVQSFYQGLIGEMAVQTSGADRLKNNSATLRDSVDQRREAVSGVSLDEEMTNLIQFQHAYNAAARGITTIDEMLDMIINRMGVVGR